MEALTSRPLSRMVVTVAQLAPASDDADHLMIFGDGGHAHLNAMVGTLADGEGASPCGGIPGDQISRLKFVVFVFFLDLQQLLIAEIFPLQFLGGPDVLVHFGDLRLQGGVFRLQRFVREDIVVQPQCLPVDGGHTAAQRLQHGAHHIFADGRGAGNGHHNGGDDGKGHRHDQQGLDFGCE